MTRIRMILAGPGGELDSMALDLPDDHADTNPTAIADAIIAWLQGDACILSPGDTISITEA